VTTRLSPAGDHYLRELEADPSADDLVDAIYETIERLTENPGSADMRKARFSHPDGYALWLVKIPNRYHRHAPRIMLWQPADDGSGDLLIAYIGPDTFRPGK
jgi:hypothetical protein